ncbi:MAG: hypothetical protein PHE29_12315 [Tissierellia bacterium]|nr:hypothetical protein [Tissierellia bacterium]MDD4780951.1 hypothetical protein [Tissierellia bacterium]
MTDTNIQKVEVPLELEKKYYKLDFAKLARSIVQDLDATNGSNIFFKTFPKEKVIDALQNPKKNEQTLRNLSNFLYILSPQYRRLCTYHAEMPTMDWYIEPYKLDISKINIKSFKKMYDETLYELDNMNIKHEMLKALQVVYREGIFYGYEHKTEDSYFIQKLNADYCRIKTVEDGVYNYEFNFQYFELDETRLEKYATEFTTKYNLYKNSKKSRKKGVDLQWQEIDSEYSICIKADETILYPFPPFVGVFPDVYEIHDYKALKKANSEMQNYALISGTIPMKKSDVADDFAITLDTAINFGNKIVSELPDQVGFMLSVYDDMQLFKLSDDKVGTDKVEEAVNTFWNAAGVSKNLFTDGGTTDSTVRASIITDEQSIFVMLRQIERWLNRKLKFNSKKYKFKLNMLNVTYQNQKEKVAEELKMAQFGIPNRIRLIATAGMSVSSIESMNFLESVLNIPQSWVPLNSSHTSSDVNSPTNGETGRVSKEEDDVRTDGGE